MLEVIASIDDDRQIFRRKDLSESVCEFRATDTACKSNNSQFTLLQLPSRTAIRLMGTFQGAQIIHKNKETFSTLILSRIFGINSGYPTKNIPCGSQFSGKSKTVRIVSCANKGQQAQTPPSPSACAASRSCIPAAATD